MNLARVEWGPVIKAAAQEYRRDDVPSLAAAMAYHFLFALFPFVIFLAGLASLAGRLIGTDSLFDQIMAYLYGALPPSTADALRVPLEGILRGQHGGAISLGALLALWSASNGVSTIMSAFNRAYGVEETRGFLQRSALAVVLTLVFSLLLVVGFVLLLLGGQIGEFIANLVGLGNVFTAVWNVVRVIAALIGVAFALAILYWKGPNVGQPFAFITPGSVATTLVWLAATVLFGLYVQYLGASSYSKTYGTAFGLVLFLLYLYLTSNVLIFGAELNAEAAKREDPALLRDKMRQPAKPLPGRLPLSHPQAAAPARAGRSVSSSGPLGAPPSSRSTGAHVAGHGGDQGDQAGIPGEPQPGWHAGMRAGMRARLLEPRRGLLTADRTAMATLAVTAVALIGAIAAAAARTDARKRG